MRIKTLLSVGALIASLFGPVESTLARGTDKGSLEVKVVTIEGQPVRGATVYWFRQGQPMGGRLIQKLTDVDGLVRFLDLDAGSYTVAAHKEEDGYADPLFSFNATEGSQRSVQIVSGETAKVTLRLGPKAATLIIFAVDSETGASIKGAQAILSRAGQGDAAPQYVSGESLKFLAPPGAPLTLKVTCEGYKEWVYHDPSGGGDTFTLASGEGKTITVKLRK